ncbi:MAG TPA: methytransferase partner Trm112 [Dehalococcoidia bacterium]|nr:methytransferase partner Trm112 [Dehalococcoidia bacterium]
MKKELMELLVCPVCKGPLQLRVDKQEEGEIIAGSLYCPRCQYSYPIVDAIPNLLPPSEQQT